MKKFNKRKAIILSLSSIIFVTTLSVFLSFVINPNKNLLVNNVTELKNRSTREEVLENENINSLIKIENSVNGYLKYFDSYLIKKNLPLVVNEMVNRSKSINYSFNELYSNIFFKVLSNDEISIKIELTPRTNKYVTYLSKFKLIIK